MKTLNLFICTTLLLALSINVIAQGGTWIWVNGSDTARPQPVYGVKGISDVHNTPRGLWGCANWMDNEGNFWLYGGMYDSFPPHSIALVSTSDLWKYNPLNNSWTWMNGPGRPNVPAVYGIQKIASAANNPGALTGGFLCWTDKNDNLWLYGGYSGTSSNALWKYSIASNQWVWINGGDDFYHFACLYGNLQQPSLDNTPGNRTGTNGSWVDKNDNLWLYGGGGGTYDEIYDDIWKYDIVNDEWTWMKGPQGFGSEGNYGIMGVENAANLPPPRLNFTSWQDKDGNFYIFGGATGISLNQAYFNDVWEYNILTNNWIWLAGDNGVDHIEKVYKEYCDSTDNVPYPRHLSSETCTLRGSNVFYLFGGAVGNMLKNILNDLWVFNPKNNNWTWLSGSSQYNDLGSYGVRGVESVTNQMPARYGQSEWVDKNGVLWVFGGVGHDTLSNGRYPCCQVQTKNDLWKFIPDTSCLPVQCNTLNSNSIDIYIPNAFSPNGDGVNDRFSVFSKNPLSAYAIKIFNRWGEIVYESQNLSEVNDTSGGWDGTYKGKLQEPGVFIYEVTGKNLSGNPFNKKGSVTLIR